MRHLNKIATAFCGLALGLVALSGCEGADLYENETPDWLAEKIDSINAAKGVLLACGGYPGNPYMMEQLDPLGTSVTTACSFSPSDKGMGIRAAVWA